MQSVRDTLTVLSVVIIAVAVSVTGIARAQGATASVAQAARGPVPASEYTKWESVAGADLSPDGKWIAYELRRVNGANELRYRLVAGGAEQTVARGSAPRFTRDSRWLAYTIAPDTSGSEGSGAGGRGAGGRGAGGRGGRGGAGGAGARNKVGLIDLSAGTTVSFDDVQSFELSRDGAHAALRRYRAPAAAGSPPAARGADLVVRNLAGGTQVTFGNIAEFAWAGAGTLLAMTVDVDGRTGNGVQLFDATTGALRSLDAGDHDYTGIAWRAESNDLAVFRSRTDTMFVDTSVVVIAWKDVSATPSRLEYDFSTDASFSKDTRVASYRALQWSENGSSLVFGIAPREPKPAPAGRGGRGGRAGSAPARVQVWHWKDLRQFHQQEVGAAQDRRRTLPVSWNVSSDHVVRLSYDPYETLQFSEQRNAAIASDQSPYAQEVMTGRSYRDVYRVDVGTGNRVQVVAHAIGATAISPSGAHVLYAQKGHWWAFDASTGKRTNLTGKIRSSFVNLEDDHPLPERSVYGFAGWTPDERAAVVYDRFDVWRLSVDGSAAERLTRGREDTTIYRYVSLDPDRAGGGFGGRGGGGGGGGAQAIDFSKPVMLSMFGNRSKQSGYAKLAAGKVEPLVWRDKSVTQIRKARDAETYVYLEQSFGDSPDYFVATSDALGSATQVSHTNAFQSDYAWGRQELMDYRNKRGEKLQMMLTYPANYEPGKKYPMVVHYYELLSQGFNQYVGLSDRTVYNTQVFSQNGYFVLRPDVVFEKRNPGWSGLDCVTSAVKTVLASVGDIDGKRVGAMGHSWGGYQSAFYAVHAPGTFAAAIAGAPLTNLISMYGYTSGNSGFAESQHFETSQERMEVPLWEDREAYIRNSTVFAMDSLRIPLLLEEGDSDGNVNPFQSQELYNFGRRLGKQVVYLVYEGENHNVARAESQRDYQKRQLEWFAHYLKDEPAADWISNGETYLERQRILRDGTPPAAQRPGGGGAP
ncbi:MAG: prolyl oligopeptidase family serine peptidase [Gemmatimonadetes bacterium]|nr:prolyl oligopeptidase family serine peptidase [Gemmatimonadota bacterium]